MQLYHLTRASLLAISLVLARRLTNRPSFARSGLGRPLNRYRDMMVTKLSSQYS